MKKAVLIGDSIRMGYQPYVEQALGGQVEVWGPEQNGGTSENVLAHLDEWVISRQPDLVNLNCGLHDLRREFGVEKPAVPLERYRRNLHKIFRRLRESYKGKVIWAQITPVNEEWHHANKPFDRLAADVLAYNRVATEACAAWDIPINDLHRAVMEAGRDRLLCADGVHFTEEGYAFLGQLVAEAIKRAFAPSAPAHLKKQVAAVIVGAGHRSLTYASYAQHHPDELRIVGVADPNPLRRQQVAALYGLSPSQCFESAEELAARPQIADVVINGTMDQQHVPTALPLLAVGYDMLLEKPIATSQAELMQLVDAVKQYQRKVVICHVLRYAPFYVAVRQKVLEGILGEIVNVQTIEHVSYHHMAVGFVRGKWNSKARCGSSMLMAKCCHDLDLLAWMKSGVPPRSVASFGSNMQFRSEKAPKGAGTRCLVDCPIEAECLYSARKHYLDHPHRWSFYVWASLEHVPNPTIEDKIASLEGDNPYGRCIWKCDNDVVDHQSVVVEFADGSTATHNMVGGAARPSRAIHLVGTRGELQGVLEDQRFAIRMIDPRPGCEYAEEWFDTSVKGDMHGAFGGHAGGDLRLVADFLSVIRGEPPSISTTTLEDSINGHLIGFSADRAMAEHRAVDLACTN